jgi:hypothetical protein
MQFKEYLKTSSRNASQVVDLDIQDACRGTFLPERELMSHRRELELQIEYK